MILSIKILTEVDIKALFNQVARSGTQRNKKKFDNDYYHYDFVHRLKILYNQIKGKSKYFKL